MVNVKRPPYENFDPGKYPTMDEYDLVELKRDGWFCCLIIEGSTAEFWSRSSRFIREAKVDGDFKKCILYGELIFGTEWARDQDEYNSLAVFDAEMLHGEDIKDTSFSCRRDLLEGFFKRVTPRVDHPMFLVDQFPIEVASDVWQEFVVEQKFEGLIFKRSDMRWGESMARMKARATMDYVCMSLEESDSDTYEGWGVKSIQGGLYVDGELKSICRVSGLTNEWRKELFDHPEKYIGQVFEAEGKKITKKGALRHPNFIRWRSDKNPEECVR